MCCSKNSRYGTRLSSQTVELRWISSQDNTGQIHDYGIDSPVFKQTKKSTITMTMKLPKQTALGFSFVCVGVQSWFLTAWPDQMTRVDYTSVLPAGYRPELEALLFFNPEQHRFRDSIRRVIEQHGMPVIHMENNRLTVRLIAPPIRRGVAATGSPPRSHPEKQSPRDEALGEPVAGGAGVQTLYALAGSKARSRLVGVMVYTRSNTAMLTVLHLAVSEDFSSQGRHSKQMMVPLFIGKLREVGRQIKGITHLRMLYGRDAFREIPV